MLKKYFSQSTSAQMEKLKKVSLYKRQMTKMGIPFNSPKSENMLKECLAEGTCSSFFSLADQLQTQSEPTFCGLSTLASVLNSLGIDPRHKWKGYNLNLNRCV
jgi:glutathione gamma-glutamylcysteinyltransferase